MSTFTHKFVDRVYTQIEIESGDIKTVLNLKANIELDFCDDDFNQSHRDELETAALKYAEDHKDIYDSVRMISKDKD
ncbi:hypothetical protein [Ponticaulis profundi]|uniref:Addiction module antitoxin n=1 Tax=Ponticaulis profundi TaxID=2665222 RepID=A0ABW1SAR1_9PROT